MKITTITGVAVDWQFAPESFDAVTAVEMLHGRDIAYLPVDPASAESPDE